MNTDEQTYNTNTNAMGTHPTTAPTGAYDSTNHTTTNAAVGTNESGHKASMLEKVKGKMESVAGALTGNHAKKHEGDLRAAGDHPDQYMNEKGQMTSSQPKHNDTHNNTYNNNANSNNVYDPATNAAHANQDAFHNSGYTNTNTNNVHDSTYGSHDNNNVGKPTMTENLKGKMQQGMGAMTGNKAEQAEGMARQEGTHSNQYMDQNGRMTSTVADNNSTRDLPDHAANPTLTSSGAGAGIHHHQGQHGQLHEERDVTLGQTLQGKAQAAMGAMTGNQAKKQEGELRQDGMHPDQRMDALGRVTGASTDTGFNAASNDHYQATPGTHQNQTPYGVTTGSLNQQPMHGNTTGINTAGSYPNTSEYGRGPNENLDSHHNQAGHASLGDRVSGAMHQQKGRMMNDPEEVRQGQMLSDGTLPTQHNQTTHNQQTNHY